MTLNYTTVDVFTDKKFAGNPLAVIQDDGVSAKDMQHIAREFNYSETTFILPPRDPSNTAHVRIFTPHNELPFAGHPNIGTAFVIALQGHLFDKPVGNTVVFEEAAGLVPIKILRNETNEVIGAELTAPKEPSLGAHIDPSALAESLGLNPEDIRTQSHPPLIASIGVPCPLAELRDLDSLGRAKPKRNILLDKPEPIEIIFLYTRIDEQPSRRFRARLFAPNFGISEDPATGSACGALAGVLGTLEKSDGTYIYEIAQGVEMGRPSIITTTAEVSEGNIKSVKVAGQCALVMQGTINL